MSAGPGPEPADDALAEALAARTLELCAIASPIGEERAICDHVERWAQAQPFHRVRRVRNSLVVSIDPIEPREPLPLSPRAAGQGGGVRAGEEGRGEGGGSIDPIEPRKPLPLSPRAAGQGGGVRAGGEGRGEGGAWRSGDRPLVALCGHLDTIPPPAADRGVAPRREGDRLVATGASDMKSGLAVMMSLAEALPRERRFCDLVLVFYAREEGPFLENELGDVLREAPELSRADLALCLEPTDDVLQLGCVGSIHATFVFTGRAAHSARPWQGENAVHRAGALLAELHARPPREATQGGLVYREVASVTRIEGGHARNVVPDRCTLNLNVRFAPDRTLDEAAEDVRRLGARHGAEVTLTDLSPACPAFADHPLVARLRERTGIAVAPKQAWTDVARLAAHGVPAANLGPGATAQAHQQGEWVEVAALARSQRRYEAFLSR